MSAAGRPSMADFARGLLALVGLVVLVIGVPAGLIMLVGWPLPTTWPSSDAVADALARTGVSDRTVVKIVACVLWVAWAQVAFGVVAEIAGFIRRRDLRLVPVCGPLRRLAASLVASVTVLVTAANAAPLPPLRSVAVAAVPFAPVVAEPVVARHVAPPPGPTWTVRPRDTLWGIAEQTLGRGERWADIRRANVGRSVAPGVTFTEHTEVIHPGWVLSLPVDATVADPAPEPPAEPAATTVVVEAGDTLSALARRCLGAADRWPELWEANRGRDFDGRLFLDPNLILPGWSLIVPGTAPTGAPVGPSPAPPASAPEPATAREPAPEPTSASPASAPAAPVTVSRSLLPPAAAEDVGIPATATAVTERPAWVMPAGIAGLALLATGMAGLAASRRRRRLRSTGLGHALPVADPDLVPTAAAVAFADDPVGMARLDVALRHLAAALAPDASGTPRPQLVRRYRSGALEVTLDRPLAGPPRHWQRGADACCVVLPAEVPIAVLVDGAGTAPSPCPALVMFGLDNDAELYVDLEALGLVRLDGAPDSVAAVARAVVATLAVSPLADLVHVVTSGVDCYGFANEERVQSVSDPDAALDLAAALSAGVRHAIGDGGTHDLRRDAPEEPWEPVVAILLRPQLTPAQLADIERLVASGGVAVVTDAEVPGARYRLHADGDGHWQLEPLGAMVTATGLAAVELADLGALLADAKAPPVELPPRLDEALSTEPFEEAPWALLVRLLGPVEVVNRRGEPAPFERAKALELVAWLAQHRARSTRVGARTAMWETDVRDATFANVVSDARRALTAIALPPDGDEWLGRTYGDHLPLHPLVVTDAELLAARLEHARRQAPPAAIETLRPALAAVHDAPYAGTAWLWPDGAGLPSNLTLLVTNSAALMAEHCLELGDHDGVFWATAQGMKVLPGHDELVCLRMHAHAAAGNLAGVRQEFESYERVVVADAWGDGSLSPKVVHLRNRLLAPTRVSEEGSWP